MTKNKSFVLLQIIGFFCWAAPAAGAVLMGGIVGGAGLSSSRNLDDAVASDVARHVSAGDVMMWTAFMTAILILLFYVLGCRRLSGGRGPKWLAWTMVLSAVPLFPIWLLISEAARVFLS